MEKDYDWFEEQDKLFKLEQKEKRAKNKLDLLMMEKVIISCVDLLNLRQLEDLRYLLTQKIKKKKIWLRIKQNEK